MIHERDVCRIVGRMSASAEAAAVEFFLNVTTPLQSDTVELRILSATELQDQ